MIPKSYKKSVVGGKGVFMSFVFIAILLRLAYYALSDQSFSASCNHSYLWPLLAPFFQNDLVSLGSALACVALLAWLLSYANNKYMLIRQKTGLAIAFPFLLFSCHPSFFAMSAQYVAVLFVVYAFFILFSVHNNARHSQNFVLNISTLLALGSLFAPVLILYFPVFWIGLVLMNTFSFRSFLASLVSISIIYFPIFSYFFATQQPEAFIAPFLHIIDQQQANHPAFLSFDYIDWAILVFSCLMLLIVTIKYYATKYKDKIKIRACLSFLGILTIVSILFFFLLNTDSSVFLYVAFASSSLLLAHFYALTEEKWIVVLFYLSVLIAIAISLRPLITIL